MGRSYVCLSSYLICEITGWILMNLSYLVGEICIKICGANLILVISSNHDLSGF
jgi:hypothetical protein